ncbi:MAG: hypothetical protein JWM11_444 [Planctomycetaceae bacterium]|nr:hypothetical protein [Planctomycetaceae bacterium]
MTGRNLTVNVQRRTSLSSLIRTVFLVGLLLGLLPFGWAADPDPEFRNAKAAFIKQFRKKAPTDRIQAIEDLMAFPRAETAELLMKKSLSENDPDVKLAAHKAVRKLAQDPAMAKSLLEDLKKILKKPLLAETTPELFRALSTTDDTTLQAELLKALDDYLGSSRGNLLIPVSLVDDFVKEGDEEAFKAITLFSKSKAFDTKFGYRRCIVQAMSQVKHKDAVKFLINTMPNAQGLIHHDIILYLTKLTKQKFRDDHQDWFDWWKDASANFEFPAILPVVNDEPLDDKLPTYYGMPICAKRIVFVLDTSGSMRGYPIDAAKNALLEVIAKLPESVNFDVVLFDRVAVDWQPRLVPATEEYRELAMQVVRAKGLGLGTASFAALGAAFDLEPEAIYFLSDGEPTDGSPNEIVHTIRTKNKTRRCSIHTIGVITDKSNGAGLTFFMKPLAEENYGTFRLVN